MVFGKKYNGHHLFIKDVFVLPLIVVFVIGLIGSLKAQSISSIIPITGPIGTSVTIKGTGFDTTPSNNVVYFGGVKAIVQSASATMLEVSVPIGAGYDQISVTVNGTIAQSNESFVVTFDGNEVIDANTFLSVQTEAASSGAAFSVLGDMDGDGLLDVVTTYNGSTQIGVYPNTSSGAGSIGLGTLSLYTAHLNIQEIVLSDFDGDGKLDIATCTVGDNTTHGKVSILRNTSSGTGNFSFAAPIDYDLGINANLFGLAAGDLDGDGRLDLAIAYSSLDRVRVLNNQSSGSGDINFIQQLDIATGTGPVSIKIADIDGDESPDIVVVDQTSNASVIRNTSTVGSFSFATKVDFALDALPSHVMTGDLDGDGLIDIITSHTSAQLSVLRNTSSVGSLSMDTRLDYSSLSNQTALADINGDGLIEMVYYSNGSVNVYKNTSTFGSINYDSPQAYNTGGIGVSSIAIGDMDNDGEPDLVSPYSGFPFGGGIGIFKNALSDNDLLSFSFAEQTEAATIDAVNHTIDIEVASGTKVTNLIATFSSPSTATGVSVGATSQISGSTTNDFTNPVIYTVAAEDATTQDWTITVTVEVACSTDNVMVDRESTGHFYFDGQFLTNSGTYNATLTNQSGCDSLVTLNLSILPVAGYSFVEMNTTITSVANASSHLAELNNDNYQDLLISGEDENGTLITKVYLNNGLGVFVEKTGQPFVGLTCEAESIDFGDVDNDQDMDIIIAGFDSSGDPFTGLYLNDGNADFTLSTSSSFTQVGRASVLFGDFITGGGIDLLISGDDGANVSSQVYENDGTGIFSNPSPVLGGFFPSIDAADLNGGGDLDWVMNSIQLGSLDATQVYIGNGDGSYVYPPQNYFNAYLGSVRLVDVDVDGFDDLFVTGRNSSTSTNISASIYLNDGNAQFTELNDHGLTGVSGGDVEFVDFDLDGDLDAILLGDSTSLVASTYLFENDGNGTFSLVDAVELENLREGSISVADINGDGLPDLFVNGKDESGAPRSIVYKFCLIDDIEVNETVCDSYVFDGIARTTSGTFNATFTNQAGCDSLVTLNLTVLGETHHKTIYTTDSSFEFDGNTLTNTGYFDATLTNQYGCDSVVHLSLTFEPEPSTVNSHLWFEPITPTNTPQRNADFYGLTYGVIRMADIDDDGDLDVAMNGGNRQDFSGITQMYTRVYRNDGRANFREILDTNLKGRYNGDMQLFDADGDGDLDMLQSGWVDNVTPTTTLDINDGNGRYTTKSNSGLPDLAYGRIGVGDFDNDGDVDLVMSGLDASLSLTSKVFFNNGHGEFVEDINSNLNPLREGGIAVGDLNGDSLPDIIMTGTNGSNQSYVFLNSGNGFTEHTGAGLDPFNTKVALLDVDQNNTLDVIIKRNVYLNDGTGTFTLDTSAPLSSFINPVGFLVDDFDQDGITDLAIPKKSKTQILYGDGQGGFDLSEELNGVGQGGFAVGDLNGDGFPEIVTSGVVEGANNRVDSDLYVNDGAGKFNRNILNSVAELSYGDAQFADLDGDGDQDLITCGNAIEAWSIYDDDEETTKLYINDGLGNFTENTAHNFLQLDGNIELADFDGDGDIDVLLSGYEYNSLSSDPVPYDGVTAMYFNDGSGNFQAVTNTGLPEETSFHMMEAVDLDNDGDQDLIMKSRVFINDGSGNFTESANHDIVGVSRMVLAVADADGNGYPDVFINGDGSSNNEGRLYLNDGTGGLYFDSRNTFKTMIGGTADFSDIDGDGDQDLFVAGWKNEYSAVYQKASVYFNDGTGLYSSDQFNSIINIGDGDSEFADLDGDGDQDLVISGWDDHNNENTTKLYINNGVGTFKVYEYGSFVNVRGSSVAIADVDGYGGSEVFISGYRHNTESRLYRNTVCEDTSQDLVIEVCESYNFYGQELTTSGIYTHDFINGCGKTHTIYLDLTISETLSVTEVESCESYHWNGVDYTISGTYQELFTNSAGCDSTAVLDLTILHADAVEEYIEICDSYEFDGQVLDATGTYNATFTNQAGCDSLVTLQLTILESDIVNKDVEVCDGFDFDGSFLTSSGLYAATFINEVGCDSLVNLNLTILESDEVAVNQQACGSYFFDGMDLTSSGTYNADFTNQAGCDSLVTLNLTILEIEEGIENQTACESYSWEGETFTKTGVYLKILESSVGCDSLATLNLTILESDQVTVNENACGSYFFDGMDLTSTGTYNADFTNQAGCDSLVTLHLTILEAKEGELVTSSCESYEWEGVTYNASGSYVKILESAQGCDSLARLDLTILHSDKEEVGIEVCGEYEFGSQVITESGVYEELFTNQAGCDSLVTLAIGLIDEPSTEIENHGRVLFAAQRNAASYQWFDCDTDQVIDGEDKRQLTPPRSGNYAVEVGNGICTVMSDCYFFDWVMETKQLESQIKIYPTITDNELTIDFGQRIDQASFEMLSLDGRVLSQQWVSNVSSFEFRIDAPRGIYLVKVKTEKSEQTQRIIINK